MDATKVNTAGKLAGAVTAVTVLIAGCWTGAIRLATTLGGVASDAQVEAQVASQLRPVARQVDRIDMQVDSVRDSLQDAEEEREQADAERDSLWRAMRKVRGDVNSILWIVCTQAGLATTNERCRSVE